QELQQAAEETSKFYRELPHEHRARLAWEAAIETRFAASSHSLHRILAAKVFPNLPSEQEKMVSKIEATLGDHQFDRGADRNENDYPENNSKAADKSDAFQKSDPKTVEETHRPHPGDVERTEESPTSQPSDPKAAADSRGSDRGDSEASQKTPSPGSDEIEADSQNRGQSSADFTLPPKKEGQAHDVEIHNAGLVILAPFLQRFFANLNLLAESPAKFLDEGFAHRAVLLLEWLATGESETSNPLLPLNRLLCGLEPFEPIPVEWEPTESEQSAAAEFLEAVIGHGPMWKTLSIDGFRTSYLQRNGVLVNSPNGWRLHVEPKAWDITMEALPWSFQTVKLPWMAAPALVDWVWVH
ncbi:MAG: contractile injection system tape measure protein, partial [Verrucomicrobiota bacterium]